MGTMDAGVLVLRVVAGLGPGAISLDHALGLDCPGDARAASLLLGTVAALVALLLPRLATPASAAAVSR